MQHLNAQNPSMIAPAIDPPAISAMSSVVRDDDWGGSTRGTLWPIVELRHCRNVMFSPDGSGVSSDSGNGAVEFDAGMFEGKDAVLLYPSKERANDDERYH
jgi:hypothetical protein